MDYLINSICGGEEVKVLVVFSVEVSSFTLEIILATDASQTQREYHELKIFQKGIKFLNFFLIRDWPIGQTSEAENRCQSKTVESKAKKLSQILTILGFCSISSLS